MNPQIVAARHFKYFYKNLIFSILILSFLHRDAEDHVSDVEQDNESIRSSGSLASEATITPEGVSSRSAPVKQLTTPTPLRRSVSIAPIVQEVFSFFITVFFHNAIGFPLSNGTTRFCS